ncbi:MAG TPA: PIG-L family deacetylase [Lacunisphaera sp.]|nr:PIG-L family deacetylase [Lacunisphaera sp.]
MSSPRKSRREAAKLFLRQIAVQACGILLRAGSRPFEVREETTVVIAPHQDDEALGCGGIIARKRNEGVPVHVIFITDGSASHPGHSRVTAEELALLRRTEAMRALACLGVERTAVHFLEEPDGTLNVISPGRREALVSRLAGLLASLGPAEVFLPCQPDGSSEHDATFDFVIDAILRCGVRPDIWEYPVWSWWNPGLLLRRWLRSKDCRRLPLEDYHQGKHQAIGCYASQIQPLAPDSLPALPPELVAIFHQDTEFFFRYDLSAKTP